MAKLIMKSTLTLPPSVILSFSVVTFLNCRFNDQQDLEQASAIVLELQSQCVDLDQSLTAINSRVQSSLLAYASFSDRIHSLVTDTTSKLTDLGSLTSASSSFSARGDPPRLSAVIHPFQAVFNGIIDYEINLNYSPVCDSVLLRRHVSERQIQRPARSRAGIRYSIGATVTMCRFRPVSHCHQFKSPIESPSLRFLLRSNSQPRH
ncbi:hypothetical protein LINPERHAP1_LOCUS14556 [Linum perenne]